MAPLIITRDERHRYLVDGTEYPAVTRIIGIVANPQLAKWRESVGTREANEIRDAAASHGTMVHAMVTMYAEGFAEIPMDCELSPVADAQLGAFKRWADTCVDYIVASEVFVASARYHYAGQLDIVAHLKGDPDDVLAIPDVKTGKRLHPTMRYQSAAYRGGAQEMGIVGTKCRRGVLWLPGGDKAGTFSFHEHTRHREDMQGFLSCLYLTQDTARGID